MEAGFSQIQSQMCLLTDCGLAPNVTLNCTDGSALVNWVASQPGCQHDCKAEWRCTNMADYHEEIVS